MSAISRLHYKDREKIEKMMFWFESFFEEARVCPILGEKQFLFVSAS